MGYSDILPKYVNATGGGTVHGELTQADIERAYASAIGDARNQYTLGYSPKSGIGGYREIEVQVRRPGVKVYAKTRILSSADAAINRFWVGLPGVAIQGRSRNAGAAEGCAWALATGGP
jgi:hypothetical protein